MPQILHMAPDSTDVQCAKSSSSVTSAKMKKRTEPCFLLVKKELVPIAAFPFLVLHIDVALESISCSVCRLARRTMVADSIVKMTIAKVHEHPSGLAHFATKFTHGTISDWHTMLCQLFIRHFCKETETIELFLYHSATTNSSISMPFQSLCLV